MTIIVKHFSTFVVLVLALVVAGCVKESPTVLQGQVNAASDINPDSAGRPSPVVMRFYELKSPKTFDSVGFFEIYEQGQQVLAEDLLNWGELELVPGGEQSINLELRAQTRHIGILVAYRAIDKARWRGTVAVLPNKTNNVMIEVGQLSLVVKHQ